jgi:hypothetical protein
MAHQLRFDRLVSDVAAAFGELDASAPREPGKDFAPGLGPLGEPYAIGRVAEILRAKPDGAYAGCAKRKYPGEQAAKRPECDLVIPGEWALEFKMIRPFGDNGRVMEHWSENALHPFPGNISLVGDCFKLVESGFSERLGAILFGYEHAEVRIPLAPVIQAFELIATQVAGIRLGPCELRRVSPLIHPVHAVLIVAGWEVIRR